MSQVLLVTGGSHGIGAATAVLAAQAGWDVAVAYHRSEDAARAVVQTICQGGGKAHAFQGDISRAFYVSCLFDEIGEEMGSIAGLVHCAAVRSPVGYLHAMLPDSIEDIVRTNLCGTMWCTREAARHMAPCGGAIVLLGSEAGRFGGSLLAPYAASKAGVHMFTLSMARELGPHIRVNCVSPGIIAQERDSWKDVPIGRSGTCEEVARAILWLLSPDASYVTGAVLSVNGGR